MQNSISTYSLPQIYTIYLFYHYCWISFILFNIYQQIGLQLKYKVIIFNKIIMNLLPAIDRPKKTFKFSNPLSGIIYNNNNYLKQCQYEPDSENSGPQKRRKSHQVAHSLLEQPRSSSRLQKNYSRVRHNVFAKASDNKINYSMINAKQSNIVTQPLRSNKNIFKFPDIQIKIIDQIRSYRDFVEKNLKINLGHYFGMYFRKSLAGPLTIDLIQIVQKYLQILASKKNLDVPVETKDFPSQYFSIKSKRAFVQRIEQLQAKKNFKPIQQMIKFYCVPSRQFRQSCFRDILHMLSQSLYEKFNLSKQKQYFILDENGRLIDEICNIKFSTTLLLITKNSHFDKAYSQYKNIIDSNLQNFKKITFSEQLKKNFRENIASGKIEEGKGLTQKQIIQAQQRRKFAQSKIQMHRNSQKSLQKFNPAKTTSNFGTKSKEKAMFNRQSKSSLQSHKSLEKMVNLKPRTLSGKKRDQIYLNNFEKLCNLNSLHDITFNHLNEKKLMIKVLKTQFSLLKSKSSQQSDAIIRAFRIDPKAESIDWEQFQRINEVANCKGQNSHIVDFVGRYLPFNEYGQMDKQSLSKTLSFILNDINGEEVVLQIIWSWLEKNNLIQNNVLVRTTLQSWYEKNKMAFVIMVSLIFGTNQTSWIDMAYQILV